MLLPQPPKADLKGSPDSDTIPGFPTEGVRDFPASTSPSNSPILVRRISLDDKAKVKAYSIENDKAGWLQKKLFKKEVAWPRELYLSVLACKAIVAPSQTQRCQAPASRCAESEATTASVTTEGEGDRESGGGGGGGAIESETVVSGVSERGRGGAIEFEPVTTDGVEGDGAGIAGQGGGADEEAALQGAAADTDAAAEDSERFL